MDNIKEDGFVNRPSILDRINYDYLKAYMFDFFKSIDNKIWEVVINWGTPLTIKVDDGFESVKPKNDWELMLALGNSCALNAIYYGVDKNISRIINICTNDKKTWTNFKVAHEGTSKVQMSRLQILTIEIENLKMMDGKLLLSSMFISMTLPKSPMFVSVTLSIEIWRDPRFYKNT